jgi:hypothetical protein
MPESRRHVLLTFLGAAGVLASSPVFLAAQAGAGALHHLPPQNSPGSNNPRRIGDPDPTIGPEPRAVAKQYQGEIKSDVQKLYDLVFELKEEVDKTDATFTLSVSLVKKAQQIEKLAKQIKDRAKN